MASPVDLQSRLVPKLWTVLQEGYSWDRFRQDLLAGVIVGIVAPPLSLAFAIASGVKPEQGLSSSRPLQSNCSTFPSRRSVDGSVRSPTPFRRRPFRASTSS